MDGLEALLPTGGIAAALCAVILYLLRANSVDRKDYREAIDVWEARSDVWEKRSNEALTRYRDLQARLDQERVKRREAEDDAARQLMAVERISSEIATLRHEIQLLRHKVSEMKGL